MKVSQFGKAGPKNGIQAIQGMSHSKGTLLGNGKTNAFSGIIAPDTVKVPKSKITPKSKGKKVIVGALLKMMQGNQMKKMNAGGPQMRKNGAD